jgi:hypothetical protein
MSEDQAFYESCDAVSADAEKPMRSPEEVRASLQYEVYAAMPPDGYHKGWCDALSWVLREDEQPTEGEKDR